MIKRPNVIVVLFDKYHLNQRHFIRQWKKRFPTIVIPPINRLDKFFMFLRDNFEHITLITDIPNVVTLPQDIFYLNKKTITVNDAELIKTDYTTRLLTDQVFYEICSWLIDHRFPDKLDLL